MCTDRDFCGDEFLCERYADYLVTNVLRSHGKISASQIIYKGEIRMALLVKDNDGNVVEVLESRPVTLDEIQSHIDNWSARKAEFLALTGQTDPSQPAAPVDSAPAAPATPPVDPSQAAAPVAPADPAAAAPTDPNSVAAPTDTTAQPAAPVADPNAATPPVFPQ